MNVSLFRKLPFDPVTDLAPIALTVQIPNVLAAHASFPATSARELIRLARAKPGQITYGSSGYGTVTHLAMNGGTGVGSAFHSKNVDLARINLHPS